MNWIDIKDECPDHDGMLVVIFTCIDVPMVYPAVWNARRKSFESDAVEIGRHEVTHWMPLPPPPKSKEWLAGFDAAAKDEANGWTDPMTHNPYQPTSPYTYPDYHCGPATKEAVEWEAGYEYRQFEHHRIRIRAKLIFTTGERVLETYLN